MSDTIQDGSTNQMPTTSDSAQSPELTNYESTLDDNVQIPGDNVEQLTTAGVPATFEEGSDLGDANHTPTPDIGNIFANLENQNRRQVAQYQRSIRKTDAEIKKAFSNMVVYRADGAEIRVPIIWGTQEKAVMAIFGDNVFADGRIDRIQLPMMAIYGSGMAFAPDRFTYHKNVDFKFSNVNPRNLMESAPVIFGQWRGYPVDRTYTLVVWTRYMEIANQINEQVMLKFGHVLFLDVPELPWGVNVHLDSIGENLDTETGDASLRIIKYEYTMRAQAWIGTQPERRRTLQKIFIETGTTPFEKCPEIVSKDPCTLATENNSLDPIRDLRAKIFARESCERSKDVTVEDSLTVDDNESGSN